MKSLKFTKPDTLEQFLKILADEAVKKSRESLAEADSDPQQAYFKKSISSDLKKFKEAEGEDEEAGKDPDEDEESKEASLDEPPAQPEEDQYSEDELSILDNVSVGKLVRLVNRIRSGRALKHDVRDEFESYVQEKLDDKERKTLFIFLKSLGDIMLQLKSGQDVQDPSDPPASMKISDTEPSTSPEVETGEEEEEDKDKKGEDTTPPIKVGGGQQLSEIRKKVRELMLR